MPSYCHGGPTSGEDDQQSVDSYACAVSLTLECSRLAVCLKQLPIRRALYSWFDENAQETRRRMFTVVGQGLSWTAELGS